MHVNIDVVNTITGDVSTSGQCSLRQDDHKVGEMSARPSAMNARLLSAPDAGCSNDERHRSARAATDVKQLMQD